MGETPALQLVGLSKRFDSQLVVDGCDLEVAAGEFMTILGPSGCGKTTTIRIVAGYIAPTSGRVLLAGRDITGLPAQKRRMGMVFQDYALFPHMTVRDNVAFGLRMRRVGRTERARAVDELLELVGLSEAADARPASLSGGMQQRVAVARALAVRPEVLLLDEPFSALDAKLRVTLRGEVKRIHAETGVTTILVTHDQEEALTLSDRVVVMRSGRIEQVGSPREVYTRPTTRFVLDFVGRRTTIPAEVAGRDSDGLLRCRAGVTTLLATDPGGFAPGARVTLAVRPEQVVPCAPVSENNGTMNRFRGSVDSVEFVGSLEHLTLTVEGLEGPLLCDAPVGGYRPGEAIAVAVSPEAVVVLPGDGS